MLLSGITRGPILLVEGVEEATALTPNTPKFRLGRGFDPFDSRLLSIKLDVVLSLNGVPKGISYSLGAARKDIAPVTTLDKASFNSSSL
uniref:SFRICE_037495 n=1 Tax=Spodoptera frugiperda TaxID=7108 RepID=A0A2H1WH20_SPOFR